MEALSTVRPRRHSRPRKALEIRATVLTGKLEFIVVEAAVQADDELAPDGGAGGQWFFSGHAQVFVKRFEELGVTFGVLGQGAGATGHRQLPSEPGRSEAGREEGDSSLVR